MGGVRADVRLVELGLAPSREKARTLIMAGEVFIDTLRIDKPAQPTCFPSLSICGLPYFAASLQRHAL